MAVVPSLSKLTAFSILSTLDASNLAVLLSAAQTVYRLSYGRYRWDEEADDYSNQVEEGIIGTYITKEAVNKALEAHKTEVNRLWLLGIPTIGNRRIDITVRKYETNDKQVVVDLDSADGNGTYLEEEMHYYIEPLLHS